LLRIVEPYRHLQTYLDLLRVPDARAFPGGLGQGVRVATIEYGVDAEHPDLDEHFELAAPLQTTDPGLIGHGTLTASIISADLNGVGIEGVAPDCHHRFVPIQNGYLDPYLTHDLEPGDVVSLSIAHVGQDDLHYPIEARDLWRTWIRDWCDRGVIVCMAAGNTGTALDGPPWTPGIVVGGCSEDGRVSWSGSGYGPRVDLCAPARVYGTRRDGYGWATGTSFSTPQVAGCAVLVNSVLKARGEPPITDCREMVDTLAGRRVVTDRFGRKPVGRLTDLRLALQRVFDWPWELDLDGDGRIGFGDFLAGIRSRRGTAAARWLLDDLFPAWGRRFPADFV